MNESATPASPFSFFASKSIAIHLLRGMVAATLLMVATEVGTEHEMLSIAMGLVALVALRGCPMCWTLGLIETIRAHFKKQ